MTAESQRRRVVDILGLRSAGRKRRRPRVKGASADLLTSVTVAFVAGEERYSPEVFAHLRPMLRTELHRVGGVGVKLHPDFRYANLYHGLLGDRDLVRYPMGIPLPMRERPYFEGADRP